MCCVWGLAADVAHAQQEKKTAHILQSREISLTAMTIQSNHRKADKSFMGHDAILRAIIQRVVFLSLT